MCMRADLVDGIILPSIRNDDYNEVDFNQPNMHTKNRISDRITLFDTMNSTGTIPTELKEKDFPIRKIH